MKLYLCVILLTANCAGWTAAQRVAPGVPPQKYQQPPPPQQQYQYQQPAAAPAAVPAQAQPQAHVQPHPQHQPRPSSGQLLQAEGDHVKEHMPVPIDTSRMSAAELQFHHFKMLDVDGNHKVDGIELIKQLMHTHNEHKSHASSGQGASESGAEVRLYSDDELVGTIDMLLNQYDKNSDGYIDYSEFAQVQG